MKKALSKESPIITKEEEGRIVQTLITPANKYYVYALCKRDRTPFYIGKGSGARVLQHRDAAQQAKESIESDGTLTGEEKEEKISELTKKLQTILDENTDLQMLIIKWGLTENEALMCESALINLLEFTKETTVEELTNIVNGHASKAEKETSSDVKTKARTLERFLKECAIPERAIDGIREKVVFVKIHEFYPKCINREGLADNEKVKECVRGNWTIDRNRRDKIRYIFALYRRRVVGVFRIRRVSREVGEEYHFGLKGFPVFPEAERVLDRNIARFSSMKDAKKNLDPNSFNALKAFLKSKRTATRRTDNAVLSKLRTRIYFEIDDNIPEELAQFRDCLLKKEGNKGFFAGQYPIRYNF